jgi:hypothetical protein
MDAPKFDSNIIKWSGYYKTPEDADVVLEQKKILISSKNKLIVTAKKELSNAHIHGLDLYKFTIITADKI